MNTLKLDGTTPQSSGIPVAAKMLHDGKVVAIPTETVYGLAANAYDADAVVRVFKAKGRPQDNPLIVHISCMDEIYPLVTDVPETAKKLAEAYWPGPMTMVLPKSDLLPDEISAGLDTVAIRMPSNPVAREIIRQSGCPLAAPSANLSGRPSPTTAQHVIDDLDGKIDGVVVSGDCDVGVESTVILLANGAKRLLRPGGITPEMLEKVIGPISVDKAVLSSEVTEKVSAPGMKYKHYSPSTNVVLINGSSEAYINYVKADRKAHAAICFEEDREFLDCPCIVYGTGKNELTLAHGIFDALRKVDSLNVDNAYVHAPSHTGVGLAVYNRLLRAAAFEVIDL